MNDFAALPEPTSDEKTMATLAQVLQLVGSWIAPLIIYLIKRDSKFVSFHALQALLWQAVCMVLWMGAMVLWFIFIFAMVIPHAGRGGAGTPPPVGLLIALPFIWLLFIGVWALNLVIGIVYGIKAGRGEWAAYPIIGRWAHRIVGV